MCVCVSVCVHVYSMYSMYVFVCMYVCMYSMYVFVCVYVCMCVCVCKVCTYVCVCVYVCTVCMYLCVCVCVCNLPKHIHDITKMIFLKFLTYNDNKLALSCINC